MTWEGEASAACKPSESKTPLIPGHEAVAKIDGDKHNQDRRQEVDIAASYDELDEEEIIDVLSDFE